MKTVFILLGPRGVGKTYIGTLMEKELQIPFLQVEPYFIESTKKGTELTDGAFETAWKNIEAAIDTQLKQTDNVSLESVGAYQPFHDFYDRLNKKCTVTTVRIIAPLDMCHDRVHARD